MLPWSRSALVAGIAAVLGCSAGQPLPTRADDLVVVRGDADAAAARRMADSVYEYTGDMPDTVEVSSGVLRLSLPAGALGQRIRFGEAGCDSDGPRFRAVQLAARQAWRHLGAAAGADTVLVTVGKLAAGRWSGLTRHECSAGPAWVRLGPEYLQSSLEL